MRPGRREYEVMRELEDRGAPAVRVIGFVERPDDDAAVLVTRYLARSLQLRRLFRRLPEAARRNRERFLDAMSRRCWSSCIATASTGGTARSPTPCCCATASRSRPTSWTPRRARCTSACRTGSAGWTWRSRSRTSPATCWTSPRRQGGRSTRRTTTSPRRESLRDRYERAVGGAPSRGAHPARRALPDRGAPAAAQRAGVRGRGGHPGAGRGRGRPGARLRVAVGRRRFHAERLRQLTGLEVGEGQATILLNDLAAWAGFGRDGAHARRFRTGARSGAASVRTSMAARAGCVEVFEPTVERLRARAGRRHRPGPGLLRLLEVKWLLSEEAGQDVGDDAAIDRLAANLGAGRLVGGDGGRRGAAKLGPGGDAIPLPPVS